MLVIIDDLCTHKIIMCMQGRAWVQGLACMAVLGRARDYVVNFVMCEDYDGSLLWQVSIGIFVGLHACNAILSASPICRMIGVPSLLLCTMMMRT